MHDQLQPAVPPVIPLAPTALRTDLARSCFARTLPKIASSLLLCLTASAAVAQTSPASAPAAPAKEEAVVLSPFAVSGEKDTGYQAGNTLAGSRFNTKLSETPASVSIMTEEFLRDIGATGLEKALEYGVNANADYNAGSTAPSFFYIDGALLNDVRVNNRGLYAPKTIDFLETALPTDIYNTGRFEFSSGPNSVLFGFGSAGGVVNASTRQPDQRRTALKLNSVYGSWNAYRGEADFNIVLAKDLLALRVMGVHDEADTWRQYAGRKNDRWTAELGFKPFKTTTITALYENGDLMGHVVRPWNRIDKLSFWWRQGHQTVDNTSFGTNGSAVQNATGIRGTGNRNIFVSNNNSLIFPRTGIANTIVYESASILASGMTSGIDSRRQESGTYQTMLPIAPQASGLPSMPYNVSAYGPDTVKTNKIDRKFVRVEQQIGKNGFLELAYNKESAKGYANELTGDMALYGDPNLYLPNSDGTATRVANPNAGKLYTEQVWYHNIDNMTNQALRATASWKLELGKFGEHRLAAMDERSENYDRTFQGPEILGNSATGVPIVTTTAPESANNYLYRRNYVTPGDFSTYIVSPRVAGQVVNYGGVNYKSRLVYNSAAATRRVINSAMVATQSKFFNSRLIVTGGYRRDMATITPELQGRLGAADSRVTSGERLLNELELVGIDTAIVKSYAFRTYSAGAVLGVTKWLSAFYNQSNNNGASQTVRRMLPDASIPVPPEGLGRDFGAMLNFLDGRVFARVTAFHTSSKNDPSVRDATFVTAHRRILAGLQTAGYITQADYDVHALPAYLGDFMSDMDTHGFEVELKANPVKNWTISAAYSHTKIQRDNLGQDWNPWFAAQKAYYAKFPSTVLTTFNLPISTEVTNIENGVGNLFALNRIGYNNRMDKANAFNRYSFSEGALKGFFIGGGVRWQSKNTLQRALVGFDALGKDVLGKILYGPEIFNVDTLIGYSTRLKSGLFDRGTALRVQLNVGNILNNRDAQVIRLNRLADGIADAGYWRVVPREPRSFSLSAALDF